MLPVTHITHLETRHVVMDALVIKRLRAEASRDWDGDEHISSFATRLTREQERLASLSPPITITDEDKLQTYMEGMWNRTDIFDEKVTVRSPDPRNNFWAPRWSPVMILLLLESLRYDERESTLCQESFLVFQDFDR